MDTSLEQQIREQAYALWEKEGSPEGRDLEFWERARLMVEASSSPAASTPLQQRSSAEAAADAAMEGTFPASDPPSFNAPTGTGLPAKD